jgi:hypothetical protein
MIFYVYLSALRTSEIHFQIPIILYYLILFEQRPILPAGDTFFILFFFSSFMLYLMLNFLLLFTYAMQLINILRHLLTIIISVYERLIFFTINYCSSEISHFLGPVAKLLPQNYQRKWSVEFVFYFKTF